MNILSFFGKPGERYSAGLLALFIGIGVIITTTEFSLVAESDRWLYTIVKSLFIIAAIPPFFILRKKPSNTPTLAFFLTVYILYCLWGAWYRPLYELALFQGLIGAAFIRFRSRWIFPLFAFIGAIGQIAMIYLREHYVRDVGPMAAVDWVEIVVIFTILGLLTHYFYFRERDLREKALLRFGVLGKQSLQVAHDLKGLLQGPMMYASYLRENKSQSREEMIRGMELLYSDLEKISLMVLQLNKLAIEEDSAEWIPLHRCVENIQQLLSRRISQIKIDSSVAHSFYGQEAKMNHIFFNLFLNSVDSFRRKPVATPKIKISCDGHHLIFEDNGEEEISEIIHLLNAGSPITSRNNSGLGIYLIRENLSSMNANIEFFESTPGFGAKIRFPEIKPI